MSVFIIGEAGVNHNGDINIAKRLVDLAVECGANAIKFQTFKAEESTGLFAEKAKYQIENNQTKESQYEMIKKLELPFGQFKEIQKYCFEKGIIFISTPDGVDSLDYLVSLDVPLIKIGSTEVTNYEFLRQIGETGKNIILSTGMCNLGEVEKAIEQIYITGNTNIKLMHCTTEYPTLVDNLNLKAMVTMRDAFKLPVGLSDHTVGFEAAIAAVALGAEFIEKHITLDRNMEGPDHRASMNLNEFKEYVDHIRNTEKLLGSGIKKATANENLIMEQVRRSILVAYDLKKGTLLEKHMLVFKRPGNGIEPGMAHILVGRKIKRDLQKDEIIKWEDI